MWINRLAATSKKRMTTPGSVPIWIALREAGISFCQLLSAGCGWRSDSVTANSRPCLTHAFTLETTQLIWIALAHADGTQRSTHALGVFRRPQPTTAWLRNIAGARARFERVLHGSFERGGFRFESQTVTQQHSSTQDRAGWGGDAFPRDVRRR